MSKIIIYQKQDNQKAFADKFNIADYEVIHKFSDELSNDKITLRDLFFIQFSLFDKVEGLRSFIMKLRKKYKDNKIIILNDKGDIKDILSLLKIGVNDFINTPLEKKNLINLILNLQKHHIYEYENSEVHRLVEEDLSLVGKSKLMEAVISNIIRGFKLNKPILITGEFGTEKFKIANFIHRHGRLSNGPLVRRNVGHMRSLEDNIEDIISKLFSASFMGTLIFEELDKGEIEVEKFINYVTNFQIEKKFSNKLNILFLCSTLPKSSTDSFTKLHIVEMPPLRKIQQDIPDLVRHHMQQLSKKFAVSSIDFKDSVYPILQSYDWPGNFFEFYNLLDLLFMKALKNNMSIITEKLVPENIITGNPANIKPDVNYEIMSSDLKTARGIFEKQYISAQIKRFAGNVSNTASFIGMERTALHRKLVSLGINSDNIRQKVKQ